MLPEEAFVASLLYPANGERLVITTSGRPAINARAYLYSDAALTVPAEVYEDADGVKGDAISLDVDGRRQVVLDAYGRLPLFWGPAAGQDQLWVVINGVASQIDAATDARIDALAARVDDLEEDSDGAALAAHAVDTTGIHGIANTAVLETATGAQTKADTAQAAAVQRANHTGTQSADTLTDGTTNKAFLATERTKLTGVATGATANSTDAQLRDRSTHTGTQLAATVSDLGSAATRNVGTTTGTVAAGDDARITQAAQKTANLSDLEDVAEARDNLGLGDSAVLDVGTSAGTVAAGDDSRLSDDRDPTTHASTHASAGADPVTLAQSQVTGLTADLTAKAVATRSIATTAPLTGGGDLSTDRTIAVANATTGAVGVVQLAGDLTGSAAAPAIATGAVTSAKIADATIVDGDISGSAAITASKISGTALTASGNLSGLASNVTSRANLGAAPSAANIRHVADYIPNGTDTTSVDCSSFIQAAITAAGAGGTIVVNGRYRCDTELVLLDQQTLRGTGNWLGTNPGITANCLDFRQVSANAAMSNQKVGVRTGYVNVIRDILITGPGPTVASSRGISSDTAAMSPRLYNVQCFQWQRGIYLNGATYTKMYDCEFAYNGIGLYLDGCYDVNLYGCKFTCRANDLSSFGTGIHVNGFVRGLTMHGGSIEDYTTGIQAASLSTISINGVYMEVANTSPSVGIAATGLTGVSVSVRDCSIYLINHTSWVNMSTGTKCTLVGSGNKFIYSQIAIGDGTPAPTTPVAYNIGSSMGDVDLSGDNWDAVHYAFPNQDNAYTSNSWTSGGVTNYNVRFPLTDNGNRHLNHYMGRNLVLPTGKTITIGSVSVLDASVVDAKGDLIAGTAADTAARVAVGTNGYALVADSAQTAGIKWAASAPDVQIFTASGTWTKPTGAVSVHVVVISAGGGGGSGRRGAAGSVRCGGGGGGAGGVTVATIPASALGSSVTVTVGTGGAGGTAQTTNDTDGVNGTNGAVSSFGSTLRAGTGANNRGGGGTNAAGTGGAGGYGNMSGAGTPTGGAASATGGVGTAGTTSLYTTGGGAGGGITSGDSPSAGGAGGSSPVVSSSVAAGGLVDSTAPGAGQAQPANSGLGGLGGGGGAGSITTTAQTGGAGGIYGAGGGGGGASLNGNNSGAGGAGADGIVICTTYF